MQNNAFGKRNTNKVWVIEDRNLGVVNEVKNLGVTIANDCKIGK